MITDSVEEAKEARDKIIAKYDAEKKMKEEQDEVEKKTNEATKEDKEDEDKDDEDDEPDHDELWIHDSGNNQISLRGWLYL